MYKFSIPRQVRRDQDRPNRWRQWRRPVVAVLWLVPLLALFSTRAATAAPTVLDFEDIAAGTRITTQYSPRGVLFLNSFLGTDPAAHSGTRVLRTASLSEEIFTPIPLVMTFTSAQSRVKLVAGSTDIALNGTLTAFDAAGNMVVQDGPKLVAANVFTTLFEVRDPDATPSIRRAELRLENGIYFAIDDLEFEEGNPSGACLQASPRIVEIREADPLVNEQHHDDMLNLLIENVDKPNTTILLGPNVVLDFTKAQDKLPLSFGPCVTLTSARTFAAVSSTTAALEPATLPLPSPARTPQSLGPLLKFGPHPRNAENKVFLSVNCPADCEGQPCVPNDHVRISGFRIHGPSFGQQDVDDIGIQVFRCLDIEISNMEIAGWGGQGIQVKDGEPEGDLGGGPGQDPPDNLPGDRIGHPEQIRIFHNYIHHNQRPRGLYVIGDDHTGGYGAQVNHGAWAQIYENVFDFNRHAIEAAGTAGGYEALRNLVLKGGGVHDRYLQFHTHQFDIHGTGSKGKGGQGGNTFLFAENAFQYLVNNAIGIRGRPRDRIDIRDNVFAHEGLEYDEGDDAIYVHDRNNLDVIKIGPNNVIDFDSYGRYGVCDFDGDSIDDLFLATGKTWWYSSAGEFHWTYLSARTEGLPQVRLGYFDEDQRCDVLTESDGKWVVASGGTGPWQSIGAFGAPLSEVEFGQFDPRLRDHRPGVTRRTTHAFWRTPSGQWQVTPLAAATWQNVQSSSFPLSKLRFGDFTGDGVTDVLAVQGGRWSISPSATGAWQRLNPYLADDVSSLLIADLNHNNIDDLLRLERTELRLGSNVTKTFTWWVSDDGRSRWRKLKRYTMIHNVNIPVLPSFAFAGRFGAAPGGGVLLTDHKRFGQFYSEAEIAEGVKPDWRSRFAY